MNLLAVTRVALRALLRNKLRSFLTTLGVIIGVGAVISMVAIGEGAKATVEQVFASMGSNMLIVLPGTVTRGGAMGGFGSQPSLTWDDLRAIREELGAVRAAAAVLQTTAQVMSDEQNWSTAIVGTAPEYFLVRDWGAARGALFTQADVDGGAKVALLGQTTAAELYGERDPLGQTLRIKNVPFTVIGVLTAKGQSHHGRDNDDVVIVPQSAFLAKIQGGLAGFIQGPIFVSAVSGEAVGAALAQVTALLRERHRIGPDGDDDFSIRNLSEFAEAQQAGTNTLATLLAAIAAVSLLVGGIGIMNIMLVSVTERTREIGIRMAVGARRRDILAQFMVEALVLSLAGGLLGIVLGLLGAFQLTRVFDWPMSARPDIMALAVMVSAGIGVAFGIYPARRASRLDPIEALRYE